MNLRRHVLERLWTDRATVFTAENTVQEETGLTLQRWKVSLQDIPCRLSYTGGTSSSGRQQTALSTVSGDPVATRMQGVKLFCSPVYDIPPGSRIVVVRPTGRGRLGSLVLGNAPLASGLVLQFRSSGVPAVYAAHQEIRLAADGTYA